MALITQNPPGTAIMHHLCFSKVPQDAGWLRIARCLGRPLKGGRRARYVQKKKKRWFHSKPVKQAFKPQNSLFGHLQANDHLSGPSDCFAGMEKYWCLCRYQQYLLQGIPYIVTYKLTFFLIHLFPKSGGLCGRCSMPCAMVPTCFYTFVVQDSAQSFCSLLAHAFLDVVNAQGHNHGTCSPHCSSTVEFCSSPSASQQCSCSIELQCVMPVSLHMSQ